VIKRKCFPARGQSFPDSAIPATRDQDLNTRKAAYNGILRDLEVLPFQTGKFTLVLRIHFRKRHFSRYVAVKYKPYTIS
jgi:hypothetical protein